MEQSFCVLYTILFSSICSFHGVNGLQSVPFESQQGRSSSFVAGNVMVIDKSTLKIENFDFDGSGLEAFFYVGQWGEPGSEYGMKVDYPQENSFSPLGKFTNQSLTLQMPDGIRTWDLRWISIWSSRFRSDYGHAYVGRGISYAVPPTTTEPPLFTLEYLYETEPEDEYSFGVKLLPKSIFWSMALYSIISVFIF